MAGTPKAVVPSAPDRIFAEVRPLGPARTASSHIDPQTSNPERADGHPTYSTNWSDSRDCHAIVIQVPNFSQSSASKDPTNAACVVHASFPKGFQVSYMHTRTVSGCNWPSVCVLDSDLEWPCTSGPSNPLGQSPPCVPEESSDQSIRRSRMSDGFVSWDVVDVGYRQKFPGPPTVSEMSESYRCWHLERTLVRGCSGDHNPNVEEGAENGEGDDACNRGVHRAHVPSRQTAGEEGCNLTHGGET